MLPTFVVKGFAVAFWSRGPNTVREMNTPAGLLYTPSDEWVRREGDGTFTIGITDHAQNELGEVTFVELPEEGAEISSGAPFGVVESLKTVNELRSPIAGSAAEVNMAVVDVPSRINESPYESGWLLKIRPESEPDLSGLLDASAYAARHA